MEFEEQKIYHVRIRGKIMYAKFLNYFDGLAIFYANNRRYIVDKYDVTETVEERY